MKSLQSVYKKKHLQMDRYPLMGGQIASITQYAVSKHSVCRPFQHVKTFLRHPRADHGSYRFWLPICIFFLRWKELYRCYNCYEFISDVQHCGSKLFTYRWQWVPIYLGPWTQLGPCYEIWGTDLNFRVHWLVCNYWKILWGFFLIFQNIKKYKL